MFLNTYGVDSVFHKREVSAALATLRRCGPRALVFVVAMAMALIQFMGSAVASDGCTALNTAVLDSSRSYEILKSRFQAGDQIRVSGPSGQDLPPREPKP